LGRLTTVYAEWSNKGSNLSRLPLFDIDVMALFRNKYRIETTRLKDWDYTSDGTYFVTICTKNMTDNFGQVINCEMNLNDCGKLVASEWMRTATIRKNVILDEWIIMPNHFHGIMTLANPLMKNIRPHGRSSTIRKSSLGSIIGQFKAVTTKLIRAKGKSDFAWQPRFYDHLIRDEKSLRKIREYIVKNPGQWEFEKDMAAHCPRFL
jgi:putative transposase